MARLGIQDAFARYGATLKNPQWSVSAWTPDGTLVISLWEHHYRRGPDGTAEYASSLSRWRGPGNAEFRTNIARAFAEKSKVRLVVASTLDTAHIESGGDASKVKKDFDAKEDQEGEVLELNGDEYVFRFRRTIPANKS